MRCATKPQEAAAAPEGQCTCTVKHGAASAWQVCRQVVSYHDHVPCMIVYNLIYMNHRRHPAPWAKLGRGQGPRSHSCRRACGPHRVQGAQDGPQCALRTV